MKEEPVIQELNKSEQEYLLSLSRRTLALYLAEKKTPKPEEKGLTLRLKEKRGIFVTLKNRGELRGCIGRIFDPEPLYLEAIEYSAHAAQDPRFYYNPVKAKEVPELDIEISVLSPMRRAEGYNDIIVGKHGVYLVKDGYSAVFLPQVAPEQGWTLDETLSQLTLKAGLPADGWKSGAEFWVFTAQVFGEKEQA